MQTTCDVLIVGAGPAGSSAALASAGMGAKVIMLEKKKQVGVPVQCAEYVPWQITQEVVLPKDVIAQQIVVMRTHLPDGEVKETQARGFIIHRNLFDQHLTKTAFDAGAEIFLQTRAVGYENGVVRVKHGKQELQIKARVIIGADGPYSTVGKWMGQGNTEFIYTAQYQMHLCHGLNSTEVYFRKDIPGGYGWVFPKGTVANVGVGVDLQFGVKPREALHRFVEYLHAYGIIKPEVIKRTGGVIPTGGLVKRLHQGNMLLVGDAAGMAHPITGAGISNAVICGRMAGEIAAKAVLKNNLDVLNEYEEECRLVLDESLMRASQKRKAMEARWSGSADDEGLSRALHSSWIAFEEYWGGETNDE